MRDGGEGREGGREGGREEEGRREEGQAFLVELQMAEEATTIQMKMVHDAEYKIMAIFHSFL